ncbi:MAG: hypothetical protein IKY59_04790 [Oscillospiraceae bacterium]|nr:hypothetical protein [Oscillospiraceae bacterium]
MKRTLVLTTVLVLVLSLLAGCAGTTVVIQNCTCPTGGNTPNTPTTPAPTKPVTQGSVNTGLAVFTSVSDSASATAEKEGAIKFDITIAAVLVDDKGVIVDCKIDSVPATVKIDATGKILSDLTAAVPTKNEMGADYGMVAWGGAIAEWDAQVAALCNYAIGKTVEELKNGAIDESGKAPAGSDLASSATIYLAGYVSAIEAAVQNAQHLGAQAGDKLNLVTINAIASSTAATAEKAGNAQLDSNISVVTSKDGVITSCIIDAVQAKIGFDTTGNITSDLSAPIQTKNELGEKYGMVAWGGAIAEWNQQAAAFAAYVTGKTAAQVAGIAVTEGKPADSDLSTSVTIKIGDFQDLIAKALA